MRVLYQDYDELAGRRLLNLLPGVGLKSINRIWQVLTQRSLRNWHPRTEELSALTASKLATESLMKMFRLIKESRLLSPAAALNQFYQEFYLAWCAQQYPTEVTERSLDLEQLRHYAQRFQRLEEFLAAVALSEEWVGERLNQETQGEYLVLSTIHQAKGLEWPVVFVIGLAEGLLPHLKSLIRPLDLEEERRLFYVAVTRAQAELYLTAPEDYYAGQSAWLSTKGLSRFIKELPPETYEVQQVAEEYEDILAGVED